MNVKVHANDMVAHVWANGQEAARSHNGQFFSEGPVIYSYGHHYPAAVRFLDKPTPLFFVNGDKRSITTTRHLTHIWRATRGNQYEVPNLHAVIDPLRRAALGRVSSRDAKQVRDYLEQAGAGSAMSPEGVQALLSVMGSKADAANVRARSARAYVAAQDKAAKAEAAVLLEVARCAVAQPLEAFDFCADQVGVRFWGVQLRGLRTYSMSDVPLQLNRAWRAAKAQGRWGAAKLKSLRERENMARASLERLERRQTRGARFVASREDVKNMRAAIAEWSAAGEARARLGATARLGHAARRLQLRGSLSPLATPRAHWRNTLKRLVRAGNDAQTALGAIERREREARRAEALREWRAGESNTVPYGSGGETYLRAYLVSRDDSGQITGGELQTSMGARVPLPHAVRVFRFLKLVRERFQRSGVVTSPADAGLVVAWKANGEKVRVGHFHVDAVMGDGSFHAGCHFISWGHVQELAQALGVFELTPSDEAARATQDAYASAGGDSAYPAR